MGNPRITPLQYIASMASIIVFLFIGTNMFNELSDGYKTVIYVCFTCFSVLAGFNFSAVKAIAEIKKIWKDKELTWWEKMQMTGNIIMTGLKVMNKEWEEIHKEQGIDPKAPPKDDYSIDTNPIGSDYIPVNETTDNSNP